MFLLETWMLPPPSARACGFCIVICPPNSSFRTRGQKQVFSENIIVFSVVSGKRSHLWWNLKCKYQIGRLDSSGWNREWLCQPWVGRRRRWCPEVVTWFSLSTSAGPAPPQGSLGFSSGLLYPGSVAKGMGFGDKTRFETWLHHFLPGSAWASYLTSLCLCPFVSKMETEIPTL